MAQTLLTYQKQKDYLVCVDSDGCAMDTMDIKHIRCFGPCMVREWGLEAHQDAILSRVIYTVVALAGLWCITLLFRARESIRE